MQVLLNAIAPNSPKIVNDQLFSACTILEQFGRCITPPHYKVIMQVLCNIQVFAKAMPSLFAPNFDDFFITSSDSYQIKSLKLEILSSIATDTSITVIFQEFQVLIPVSFSMWVGILLY